MPGLSRLQQDGKDIRLNASSATTLNLPGLPSHLLYVSSAYRTYLPGGRFHRLSRTTHAVAERRPHLARCCTRLFQRINCGIVSRATITSASLPPPSPLDNSRLTSTSARPPLFHARAHNPKPASLPRFRATENACPIHQTLWTPRGLFQPPGNLPRRFRPAYATRHMTSVTIAAFSPPTARSFCTARRTHPRVRAEHCFAIPALPGNNLFADRQHCCLQRDLGRRRQAYTNGV